MVVKNIIPEKREDKKAEIVRRGDSDLMRFRNEFDRLFDDFFRDPFGLIPFRRVEVDFLPRVDVLETEKEVKVMAEIPGMEEKDVEVSLNHDILTISGEKSSENTEKNGQYHRMERTYGSFRRDIQLPSDVDPEKVEATFTKGVLTVTLPKPAETVNRVKKISIKKG
jgi:HSP20 family protein